MPETLCPMSKQGVSMAAIADSAVALGFNHHALRLTPERLQEMKLPCIPYTDSVVGKMNILLDGDQKILKESNEWIS